MKLLKNETENELTIEMVLHAKRYSLTLDKARCMGCGICVEICPREAIEIKKTPKADGEKAKPPTIDNSESFPHLIREIEVDTTRCGLDCVDCEKACPLEPLSFTEPTYVTRLLVSERETRLSKKLRPPRW